jgi:glycosyltransferase involved in cell wall biosynthesis
LGINNNFKITVIIPVYNVESYLSECIESVLNQDYDNKEILIINDGSTDRSAEIIEEYKKNNTCVKVIETENRGLSMARNLGVGLALGDFIIFLDSDDYLSPNTLTKCTEAIEKHNTDIVLFSGEIVNLSKEANKFPTLYYSRPLELVNKPLQSQYLFEKLVLLKKYIPSACLYMFKKDKFKHIEFHPGILFEDNLFTTKLLLHSSNTYAVCIPNQFYMRRIRTGSITNQAMTSHHLNSYCIIVEELLKIKAERLEASTLKALEIFIQKIIVGCIETNLKLNNSQQVKFFRFKMISYLRKLELKHIKISTIILLLFPWSISVLKSYQNRRNIF